jgi:glycerol uptake facilitator-like aquaporin
MTFGHVPGFIAAQLLGAAAAAGVCAVLFSPSAAHAVRELRRGRADVSMPHRMWQRRLRFGEPAGGG